MVATGPSILIIHLTMFHTSPLYQLNRCLTDLIKSNFVLGATRWCKDNLNVVFQLFVT